jgi:hypothetical protein
MVVVVAVAGFGLRRRSRDDVHSVEHYHRQLHTLQEMREHPSSPGDDEHAAYPAPAFRVGTSTVRLTDPNKPLVPPIPPPPVPNPSEPVKFEDEGSAEEGPASVDGAQVDGAPVDGAQSNGKAGDPSPQPDPGASVSAKGEARAMQAINHPPRRLGAPLVAVGAVTVLIVVLIVTGLHTTSSPPHHGKAATTATTAPAHHSRSGRATTTTTVAAVVSAPSGATTHDATYQVADAAYSLALDATNGECWVQVTDASGAVLFTGVLYAGQSHTVPATGSVTVIAGAPDAFSATVNGVPVSLPSGFQAPFTLKFLSPGTGGTANAATGNSGSANAASG